MIKWFKKGSRALRQKITTRVLVISLAAIALAVSGTVLMADWGTVDNQDGTDTGVYTLGNVGIGTNQPQRKLHISGDSLRIDNNNEGGGIFFNSLNASGNKSGIYWLDFSGNELWRLINDRFRDSQNKFQIRSKDAGYFFTMLQNGRVGIGTEDPTVKLDVVEDRNKYAVAIYNTNNNGEGLWIQSNGNSSTEFPLYVRTDEKSPILCVRGDGKVGIGTYLPSSIFDVAGTTTSTNYACSSDVRYKKDISPYQNALEKVLGLRGVNYFWRADEFKEKNFSKDKQIGFIAQEVEKVIPELVYTDDKGYKTMSYDRLTAVLVEAVKELNAKSDAKISALEQKSQNKISALELENAALKHKLAKLESVVTALEKSVAQNELSPEQRNGEQNKIAGR